MNLSAIMRIPDQTTRNLMYAQALEIATLKAEIDTLKSKPPNIVGFRVKGGELTLENAFINVVEKRRNTEKTMDFVGKMRYNKTR